MGLMQRLAFWRPEQKAASIDDLLRELYSAPPAKSGQVVTWKSALEVTTVLACVRVLADGIAQVPWKVYRETADGKGREVARDHWAYDLLSYKPNPWQTSYEFREQIMAHLALCSNAFVFKNMNARGQVIELLPFEPQTVTVRRNEDYSLTYKVNTEDGRQIVIPSDRMWHMRGLSWNGWFGMEAIKLAREAIGLGMASEETESRAFKQGTRLSGVLEYPAKLSDEALKRLRETWEANYSGAGNAGKTGILEDGMKFNPISQTHEDAQLLELRGFQVEEICRAFRVLPIMVGRADKAATYASAEQMFLAHVMHTLGPWYSRLELSADKNLLSGSADDKIFTKFITAGLLRGDAAARAALYGAGIKDGWMTRNEARGFEEMNPLDGLDLPLRPLNMGNGETAPSDDPPNAPEPEAQKQNNITINQAPITFNPAAVNVTLPETSVEAPNVNVMAAPAPNVNVAAPTVNVAAPAVTLSAQISVDEGETKVLRDEKGRIESFKKNKTVKVTGINE
jgi:HK97 family phage portal protein